MKKDPCLLDNNFAAVSVIRSDCGGTVRFNICYRNNTRFGTEAKTVAHEKQQKLIISTLIYPQQRRQFADKPCRFDVVSINHTKQAISGLAI